MNTRRGASERPHTRCHPRTHVQVVHPVTESDAFKEMSKKTEEGTHSFMEGLKHAGSFVAEKSAEAAAAVSEGAHKATEFVKEKAANGHHENGHEHETEEERKKREEAHKEAHEKAAEEEKK